MATPRFHAPAIDGVEPIVALPPSEAHHLVRVLRLGPGAPVHVFDGRGREWIGRVHAVTGSTASVVMDQEIEPVPEPDASVTLGTGLLKGDQMDAVVRDATMLGVRRIVPIAAAHVAVPRKAWPPGGARERWERVALASVKQCGRAAVPEIGSVSGLTPLLDESRGGWIVMCVEPAHALGSRMSSLAGEPRPSSVLLLTGPEGGWSDGEVREARHAGARLVHLGPRTLRAESAPIVALSALWTILDLP